MTTDELIEASWGDDVVKVLSGGRMIRERTVPTALEMSEGQLFGRLVPFGVVARVVDKMPDGSIQRYLEGFRPGIFTRQMQSTEPGVIRRINLVHTHGGDIFGPAMSIEERDDGVHGEFKVFRSRRSDVEDLLEAGVQELSVEMLEMPNGFTKEAGVVWRTDAHLINVAIEAMGAYRNGARVLAYRKVDDFVEELAEEDRVIRERAEAEEAEAAAERERQEQAAAAIAKQRQLDEWLREQDAVSAELAAKYL